MQRYLSLRREITPSQIPALSGLPWRKRTGSPVPLSLTKMSAPRAVIDIHASFFQDAQRRASADGRAEGEAGRLEALVGPDYFLIHVSSAAQLGSFARLSH